jgi:hypothetical protein
MATTDVRPKGYDKTDQNSYKLLMSICLIRCCRRWKNNHLKGCVPLTFILFVSYSHHIRSCWTKLFHNSYSCIFHDSYSFSFDLSRRSNVARCEGTKCLEYGSEPRRRVQQETQKLRKKRVQKESRREEEAPFIMKHYRPEAGDK